MLIFQALHQMAAAHVRRARIDLGARFRAVGAARMELAPLPNNSEHVPFKYPLKRFKDYLIHQVEKSNITVCLNTKATAQILQDGRYDVVLPAVGAAPVIPPVPGVEHAVLATVLYGGEDAATGRIVVIGGGQVGCETALHLARLGKQVTILEMCDRLAPDASPTHREELMRELEKEPGLNIVTGLRCTRITARTVDAVTAGGEVRSLAADTVVLAAGMRARTSEVDELLSAALYVFPIGDCVRAATVEQAMRSAYTAALTL